MSLNMDILTFKGIIYLILGNMFSGKTTELCRRFRRYTIAGKKCLMIKYVNDKRYDDSMVVTHDNITINAIPCKFLMNVNALVKDFDVICIDEVQFYKDAHIFCDLWANQGKIVEACGLSGTYNRTPFDVISKLLPLAEKVTVLDAICTTNGNNAPFTKLTIEDNTGNIEIIGGEDKYSAVDRTTFFENNIDKYLNNIMDELSKIHECDIELIKQNINCPISK